MALEEFENRTEVVEMIVKVECRELGAPSKPGLATIPGFGVVHVEEADILRARQHGASPAFRLQAINSLRDPCAIYQLGPMVE